MSKNTVRVRLERNRRATIVARRSALSLVGTKPQVTAAAHLTEQPHTACRPPAVTMQTDLTTTKIRTTARSEGVPRTTRCLQNFQYQTALDCLQILVLEMTC